MSGTLAGGKAAAATNKAKYGEDFYKRIGQRGGSISTGGGFTGKSEWAKAAGKHGGRGKKRAGTTPIKELLKQQGTAYDTTQ